MVEQVVDRPVLSGALPVAPTIFREDESLDVPGTLRVLDYLVDAGSSGVCLLANYSEQFSLTDHERDLILTESVQRIGGRVPVVVTTSHFSARIARERAIRAEAAGADMVMLMPPFFGATMKVDDGAVVEFFERVADGISIDVMIQDAPMSTTPLSVSLITRLARSIGNIRYAKIEVARAAEKLESLALAAGTDLPGLFDGEEGVTAIPDLDAGAVGVMSSALLPDRIAEIVRRHRSGDRAGAVAIWEDVLPLIQFENRQCGLVAAKAVLHEAGVIDSPTVRAPLRGISPTTRHQLVELARRKAPYVFNWNPPHPR